jgi:hypothetical protein
MSNFASTGIQQVAPLPMSGSGSGKSSALDKLNNVSVTLAAASIQAAEDGKYDPKVQSGTPSVIRPGQGFCSPTADPASTLMMIGILLIVYGVIAK